MMRTEITAMSLFLASLLAASAALAAPSELGLGIKHADSGEIHVSVLLEQPNPDSRPVLADLRIQFDPKVLEFVEARTRVAGKMASGGLLPDGTLRVTLTSMSLAKLPSGTIAVLRFKRRDAKKGSKTRIGLTPATRLAPRNANTQLRLAAPVTIELARGGVR